MSKDIKDAIDALESDLRSLKKAYEDLKREVYEGGDHKVFAPGDWVKQDRRIGVVEWVENKGLGITPDMGYCGISIRTGTGGFMPSCKRNDWDLVQDEELEYLITEKNITLLLTGGEMLTLIMALKWANANDVTKKALNALHSTKKNFKWET